MLSTIVRVMEVIILRKTVIGVMAAMTVIAAGLAVIIADPAGVRYQGKRLCRK